MRTLLAVMITRRSIRIAVGVTLLTLTVYFSLRVYAARSADRLVDSFFYDFRRGDAVRVQQHLRHATQSPQVGDAILVRHKAAIENFDFQQFRPSLNFLLNRTEV